MKNAQNVLKDFESFELNIKKLESLGRELDGLETNGFESDVARIKSKLKDVSAISLVEKELDSLKEKIAEKKESVARVKSAHVASVNVHAQHAIDVDVSKKGLSFNGLFSKEAESFINSELDKRIASVKVHAEKQIVKQKQDIEKANHSKLLEAEQILKKKYESKFNSELAGKEKVLAANFDKKIFEDRGLLEKQFENKTLHLEKKYLLLFKQQKDELALIQSKESDLRASLKKEFDANFKIACARLKDEHDAMMNGLKAEKAKFIALQNEHSVIVENLRNKELELKNTELGLKKDFAELVERKDKEFVNAKKALDCEFKARVNDSLKRTVDERFNALVKDKIEVIKSKIIKSYGEKFGVQQKLFEDKIKDFFDSKYNADAEKHEVLMQGLLQQEKNVLMEKHARLIEKNARWLAEQKRLIEKDYAGKSSVLVSSKFAELQKDFETKLKIKSAELNKKNAERLGNKLEELENKKKSLDLDFAAKIKSELGKNDKQMDSFKNETGKKYELLFSKNVARVETEFSNRRILLEKNVSDKLAGLKRQEVDLRQKESKITADSKKFIAEHKTMLDEEFSQKFDDLKKQESALSVLESGLKQKESKLVADSKKFITEHKTMLDKEFAQKFDELKKKESLLANFEVELKNKESKITADSKKFITEHKTALDKEFAQKFDDLKKQESALSVLESGLKQKESKLVADSKKFITEHKTALDEEFSQKFEKLNSREKELADFKADLKEKHSLLVENNKKWLAEQRHLIEKDFGQKSSGLVLARYEKLQKEFESKLIAKSKELNGKNSEYLASRNAEIEEKKRSLDSEFNHLLSVERKKLQSELLSKFEKENAGKLKILEAKLLEKVEFERNKLLASEIKRLESVSDEKLAKLKSELEREYKHKEMLFLESKRELFKKELAHSLKKIF